MSTSQQRAQRTQQTVQKIQASGQAISPDQVVSAWHIPSNGTSEFPLAEVAGPGNEPQPYVWVEQGHSRKGLIHMMGTHGDGFEKRGIPAAEQPTRLPVLAQASTLVGRHVGWLNAQRETTGRPVMATYMKEQGKLHRTAVQISTNGYAVSMQPIKKKNINRRPGEPKEVSDRTMENLYFYPPNQPERRSTHEAQGSQKQAQQPRKQTTL